MYSLPPYDGVGRWDGQLVSLKVCLFDVHVPSGQSF